MEEKEEVRQGEIYKGLGYSGATDGEEVTGKLIHIDKRLDHGVILCLKRNEPCAVILTTLEKVNNATA